MVEIDLAKARGMDLPTLLGHLARARADIAQVKGEIRECEWNLERTPEGEELAFRRVALEAFQKSETAFDAAVREAALATGEKQPHPAVQVKTYTVVNITDAAKALEYARQHLTIAVKLDAAEYKRVAKELRVSTLPYAEVVEEQRATIAKDLSGYLG